MILNNPEPVSLFQDYVQNELDKYGLLQLPTTEARTDPLDEYDDELVIRHRDTGQIFCTFSPGVGISYDLVHFMRGLLGDAYPIELPPPALYPENFVEAAVNYAKRHDPQGEVKDGRAYITACGVIDFYGKEHSVHSPHFFALGLDAAKSLRLREMKYPTG